MSSSLNTNKTALIQAMNHECKKQHYAYDGSSRVAVLYEAPIDTKDGGSCLATKWAYSGATTTITGSVEYVDVWSSAWDITYP